MAGEQASPQADKLSTPAGIERQEQKGEPTQPTVRTKNDKLKLPAAEAEPEARRQQERRRQLLAGARDYLRNMEQKYDEEERRWINQLIEARLRMMQAEDKLRLTERDQDPANSAKYSALKAQQNELAQAESLYADKNHPRMKERREALRKVEEEWKKTEDDRSRLLRQARMEFLEAEEQLRLLERSQAFQREKARRRLEAADERLRFLEEGPLSADSSKQGLPELEHKVDRLLREMADLRREIRRQQTEGDKQSPPRRPDQP